MIKTTVEDSGYEQLCQRAAEAMENAYCPYSKYRVGAAILAESGKIYSGSNIENASYGASNCGERTALFKAVSEGERKFSAIAIFTDKGNPPPFPCGICRQALSEFCSSDMPVIVFDGDKSVYNLTLGELFPYSFEFDPKE